MRLTAKHLEIHNISDVAKRLDVDDLTSVKSMSGGQMREMYAINEPGLYNVVLRSDKPEAKRFKRWITHEVLPSIRKHGMYATPQTIEDMLNDPDVAIRLLTEIKAEREKRQLLELQVELDRPKAIFADALSVSEDCILVGNLAKILKQNGMEMGQNRFFSWLRQNGYLCRYGDMYNRPTQRAMECGLFALKETTINVPDGPPLIRTTTMVTGKGQQYFINKFKSA
jgi:anti-repressor protein